MKYKKIVRLIGASSAIFVASCTSGGVETSAAQNLDEVGLVQKKLSFDNIGQIPMQGSNKEFMIRLHNTYSNQFSLKSIDVIDPVSNKVMNSLADVKSELCSIVAANNSCSINVTPHLQSSGSFILEAKLADNEDRIFTVRQLIRLSDKVSSSNGILFDNDLATISAPDGFYHMSFPVVLEESFDELKATNGRVTCEGGLNSGSHCTYFVDGKSLADNTLVETKLEGYRGDSLVSRRSFTTRTTSEGLANLLISQPADINIGNDQNSGSSVVTLFNNGNLDAGKVQPFSNGNNLSVASNSCATGLLVPGASCTFTVQAQSEINGTGLVGANYLSGNDKSSVSTNIVYSRANIAAKLELSSLGGRLSNSFVGIPSNEFIAISNNGTRNLKGIRYTIDQQQDFTLTGSASGSIAGCEASGTLELIPGQKCALKVVYTPKAATSAALNYTLSVVGNYTNSNNLDASVMSNLSRPYSALSIANALSLSANNLNLIVQTGKTDTRPLEITNTSPFDVTLGALALTPAVTGLTIASGSTCLANNQLLSSGGGSCAVNVTYAPTIAAAETKTKLLIPIVKVGTIPQSNTTREADIAVRAVTTLAPASIKVDISAPSTLPSGVSSVGANSYNVLGLPGTGFRLTYKFTAEAGKGDATLFNVSSAGLPVGAEIISDGTTCAVGANTMSLNAGSSCAVVVETPRQSLVTHGLLASANDLSIKLPYSWQDVSAVGKIQVQKEETLAQSISVTTDWLSGFNVAAVGKFTDSGSVSIVTIKASLINLVAGAGVQYPLSVSASIAGNIVNDGTCSISSGAKDCNIDLRIPNIAPTGNYYVDVVVTDSTPAPNTRIYRKSINVSK